MGRESPTYELRTTVMPQPETVCVISEAQIGLALAVGTVPYCFSPSRWLTSLAVNAHSAPAMLRPVHVQHEASSHRNVASRSLSEKNEYKV